MASGNHVRERLARLESQVEQQRKEIELLWLAKKAVDRAQQHMRLALIVAVSVGLQHFSEPARRLLLTLLR